MEQISREQEQASGAGSASSEHAARPLPMGHRLGELQLDAVLGIGGFGIVYRAFDRTLQRVVAIKEYMPSMLAIRGGDHTVALRAERFNQAFDAGRSAFLNEARLLAQFDHPGLVKVLHFWESHGTAYMVTPFHEGQTFKQLLDSGVRMNETQLRNVVAALLGALDTLHRAQCFHRDISLDNILIRPDGGPVLLDFGAARKKIGDLVDDSGMMLKPGYAPIEQYTDDPAFTQGPWTDLYALGAVMHALITSELPPAAVVRSIQDHYQPLATRVQSLHERYSPALLAAVDHALQLRIADRPESVAEFAAELGLHGIEYTPYAPAQRPPEPSRNSETAPHIAPQPKPEAPYVEGSGSAAPDASPDTPPSAPATDAAVRRNDDASATAAPSPPAAADPAPDIDNNADADADAAPPGSPTVTTDGHSRRMLNWVSSVAQRRNVRYGAGVLLAVVIVGIGVVNLVRLPHRFATTVAQTGATPAPESARPGGATVPPSVQREAASPAPAASPSVAAPAVAAANASPPLARNDAGSAGASASDALAASLDASEVVVPMPAAPGAAPIDAAAAGGVLPQQPPRPIDAVAVRFRVRPWGEIYVGGVKRGVSPPLKSLVLSPGLYVIEIRNGNFAPLRRTLKIEAGSKPISIEYAFE